MPEKPLAMLGVTIFVLFLCAFSVSLRLCGYSPISREENASRTYLCTKATSLAIQPSFQARATAASTSPANTAVRHGGSFWA
jgi:hypothetical protein